MKRSVIWTVVVVVLGIVAYVSSNLGAKPAPALATPAHTRVVLLNLRWVIKKYDKYQDFIARMKKEEKRYLDILKQKQEQLDVFAEQMKNLQGEAREAKSKEISTIQNEMEDVKVNARKDVTAKSNEEMVAVYKTVREAATRYAKANNLDLVLHFEGAAEKDEVDSTALITRNMNAGGSVPLYWNPDLDISVPVLDALNANYKRGK